MNKKKLFLAVLVILLMAGCKRNEERISYHGFQNKIWNRFEILKFDLMIDKIDKPYDIFFFADHTKDYEFNNLDFNMIMTTPAGEERIKEYHFPLKIKTGAFTGTCTKDSCIATIVLKKGLWFTKKGIVRIEIETLVPRLEIGELCGGGIRMVPVAE